MHNSRLVNDMLNMILSSFLVLLGLATSHLVFILALFVLEIAFIFTRSDMSCIKIKVLKLIVTVVLFMMFVGGLAIEFPLLISAFVLQILLVITVEITIVSMITVNFSNYWCWTLMDDMVDRLADVMNSLFRNLVN